MEETTYDQAAMLFHAGYSKKAAILISQQLNFGSMPNPDITAQYQSECGDLLIVYLKLDGQTIGNAMYEYIGCRGLQAAASALTEMIKGMTMQEAVEIGFCDILNFLERIPPAKYDCIHLALNTLREGTKEFRESIS